MRPSLPFLWQTPLGQKVRDAWQMTASLDQCDRLDANIECSMADLHAMKELTLATGTQETAKLIVTCETHASAGACRACPVSYTHLTLPTKA